ncbi:MAG: sigma 54-interacting transcriptional regulator [Firmicutes bacterium]|nr:sigma 54-interacting transcriptional regulator [Bacillota bacterium]
MDNIVKLFKERGYIEGITIINVEGEILFTAKFNKKMNNGCNGYEVVGKKFLDIYEELDENNSSIYRAMKYGVPIYVENQTLKSTGQDPIEISSLSLPIRSGGKIVGAIDLSVTEGDQCESDHVEIKDEILYAYNKVESLQRGEDKAVYSIDDIHTCDPGMIEMKEQLVNFAKSDLPVMIYGETGTGKELVAHAIHQSSNRADKPFVAQNCASIPANLIESILFGTSKGAFTGAVDNIGLLEMADGGTLFLDEINSMPLELQPKVLRVIQDGTFRKVGGKELQHVNVRIISSTNEKLEDIVQQGKLRMDLYYRLAVLVLEIPPLRKRKQDIPLLTNLFIGKYNALFRKQIHKVSKQVLDAFLNYPWKGNVRELDSIIAAAVCMVKENEEVLEYRHVVNRLKAFEEETEIEENTGNLVGAPVGETLSDQVANFEKGLIELALKEVEGNITKAASKLNIPRQTLSRKVKEYGL